MIEYRDPMEIKAEVFEEDFDEYQEQNDLLEVNLSGSEKSRKNNPSDDIVLPYKCKNCNFQSELPHISRKHESSIIQCEQCQKTFCGRYARRKLKFCRKSHEIKPKITKIYPCVSCDRNFKFKSMLKNHLKWKCGKM